MRSVFSSVVLSVVLALSATVAGFAQDTTSVNSGGQQKTIDKHGVCRVVKNNSTAAGAMVPHRAATEWSIGVDGFLAGARPSMGVTVCPGVLSAASSKLFSCYTMPAGSSYGTQFCEIGAPFGHTAIFYPTSSTGISPCTYIGTSLTKKFNIPGNPEYFFWFEKVSVPMATKAINDEIKAEKFRFPSGQTKCHIRWRLDNTSSFLGYYMLP